MQNNQQPCGRCPACLVNALFGTMGLIAEQPLEHLERVIDSIVAPPKLPETEMEQLADEWAVFTEKTLRAVWAIRKREAQLTKLIGSEN